MALLQDGQLVYMMERRQIEGQSADLIARQLMAANHMAYPEAFEIATRQHLKDTLGLDI